MSLILTLTGMSTSGKSTLAKALAATGVYAEAVSMTTRLMRPGEVNGRDYHFVTQDIFDQHVREGHLLEHVRSHHACYGVPAFEVDRIKAEGKSVVMVLEPEGVASIQSIALHKKENFIAAFVHVGMPVVVERFFERIELTKAAGKDINYEQEAKRLHVMFSKERGWSGRFNWDMTLVNLHLEDKLEMAINQFVEFHQKGLTLESQVRTLKPEVKIDCVGEEDLVNMIKKPPATPTGLSDFVRAVLQPTIENQAKSRSSHESPSMAI